jgi:hypothetical protein
MPILAPLALAGGNPEVIPPNANPLGLTYGEWSARWWQWAFSLPVADNPFFDEGGDCTNGAQGQSGPVWFLTGVINTSGSAVRNCTVPAGRMLFFPILNVECATLENNGSTEADLRTCTESYMSVATSLAAELDGKPIQRLQRFRAASPLFTYGPLPADNVVQFIGFDAPEGATSLSAADGFYLMLAPLSVGHHTLRFTGTFEISPPFTLNITYHLTVPPDRIKTGTATRVGEPQNGNEAGRGQIKVCGLAGEQRQDLRACTFQLQSIGFDIATPGGIDDVLAPKRGGKATEVTFQSDQGQRPTLTAKLTQKQSGVEFCIDIDRAVIDAPTGISTEDCVDGETAWLTTAFSLSCAASPPLFFEQSAAWRVPASTCPQDFPNLRTP